MIELGWPYLALAAGLVILVLLCTRVFGTERWRDPRWLAWLLLAAYLVHQFEEYGIAATGERHAFPAELCAVQGFDGSCPVPASFFIAVNCGSVWIGGILCVVLARRRPTLSLSFAGLVAVNGVVHVVGSAVSGSAGAGLLTAALVFIPVAVWSGIAARGRGVPVGTLVVVAVGGLLQHAVLFGSVRLFIEGALGEPVLVAIQLVNAIIGIALVAVWERVRPPSR